MVRSQGPGSHFVRPPFPLLRLSARYILPVSSLWARFSLGPLYDNGDGVPEDDVEAVRWYRLAAEQGLDVAQYSLGVMYANGTGVPEDDAEAVRWYRLAAEQGYDVAQYTLGVRYSEGDGVPEDDREAVRWFRLAAEQGDADAQFNLARWASLVPRARDRLQNKPPLVLHLARIKRDLIFDVGGEVGKLSPNPDAGLTLIHVGVREGVRFVVLADALFVDEQNNRTGQASRFERGALHEARTALCAGRRRPVAAACYQ